jgi:hypothetical protein
MINFSFLSIPCTVKAALNLGNVRWPQKSAKIPLRPFRRKQLGDEISASHLFQRSKVKAHLQVGLSSSDAELFFVELVIKMAIFRND